MGEQDQVTIRRMSLEDLPCVQRIERQSFATPWSYNSFLSELIDNDNAHYLVAICQGRVVGYVGAWIILDEGHITNVAVDPQFRQRGIGRQLLDAMTRFVSAKAVRRMTLEVRVSNRVAQGLYAKLGYSRNGVRRGYYRDNNEDALIMWKDLTNHGMQAETDLGY